MDLPVEALKHFARLIEQHTGIVYTEVNHYQLAARLEVLAKQLGFADTKALWTKAKGEGLNAEATNLLIELATNNETSFFRDPGLFEALRQVMSEYVASRRQASAAQPVQVWSTACSTGQEVYSLAMTFEDMQATTPFSYHIRASDIAERVLARARKGTYSELEVRRGLSDARLAAYFQEDPAGHDGLKAWSVRPALRRNITFQRLNLLEPWPNLGMFDLILCRNVLIYQTVENKTRVVGKLLERLAVGGYLVLGGAESLIGISQAFEYVPHQKVTLYRKLGTNNAKSA